VLAVASGLILVASGAVSAATWWLAHPLPDDLPFGVAERLADRDQPIRLFNAYNASGVVLAFADGVLVGVDGRADYYGGEFITDYIEVIQATPGSFSRFLAADPDAALLKTDAPLTGVLQDKGWVVTDREGDWVLLEPPAG
jgi:hypothetical protein